MDRLDRAAAEVNPFLTVIAIGLAAVTLTYFAALAIKGALPPITRNNCPVSTEAKAAPPAISSMAAAARGPRQVAGDVVGHMVSARPFWSL